MLRALVNQDPVRDTSVFCLVLLGQVVLSAEVGFLGQSAAPFYGVEVELDQLLFACGMHESKVGAGAVGKVR